uniref:Cytochrome b5 heme-binding domain-containing protein n=1 Tax=Noctiluca scintillans TaxID=2966 RepID=A0A7S1AMU8_NOCSC
MAGWSCACRHRVANQHSSAPTCPVSGKQGICPAAQGKARSTPPVAEPSDGPSSPAPTSDDSASVTASPVKLAEQRPSSAEPTSKNSDRSEKVLRGDKLLLAGSFTQAEEAYDRAVEADPSDWRAHYGKAVALRGQSRILAAFRACRIGLERLPNQPDLKELQEEVRLQHKERRNQPAEPPSEPAQLPGCPASQGAAGVTLPPAPVWTGKVATADERSGMKDMMLSIFREQWARLNKEKKAVLSSTLQYSTEQKLGLQIAGGHQHMPRPEDINLPADFRGHIGNMTVEELGKYNCDQERLLISIYGDVFDVSDRPDKYGKKGPYFLFAGKDITWGLVSGADTAENCNQFFDIFKADNKDTMSKMQCICSWLAFYELEYGNPVGRLLKYDREHELPAPPATGDTCVMQ